MHEPSHVYSKLERLLLLHHTFELTALNCFNVKLLNLTAVSSGRICPLSSQTDCAPVEFDRLRTGRMDYGGYSNSSQEHKAQGSELFEMSILL